jgi:peptidoglycan/LPS O-acetylase OafA/YrhL
LWRRVPELNFGALGVACFFVISGFLVTQSWLARERVVPFVAARVLRIYPALIGAVALTLALAWMSGALGLGAFLADPQTIDYIAHVTPAWDMRHQLPGAFAGNPIPHDVNGSLWTLPIELRLYVAVLIAGMVGLLVRRAVWFAVLWLLFAWWLWRPVGLPPPPFDKVTGDLVLLFALGSLACVWRTAIPVSLALAAAALLLVIVNPADMTRGVLFAPLLAYIVLVAAYHPRLAWPAFNRAGDYSYGVYVYSFPIQQTLVQRIPGIEPASLFALAMALTLVAAALSWHFLEKPALGLKSRFGPADRTP